MILHQHFVKFSALFICLLLKESLGVVTQNACNNKNRCHECIQMPNCAWCEQPNYTQDRCFDYLLESNCPNESVFYPQESSKFISNRPLTSGKSVQTAKSVNSVKYDSQEIVQLRPQHISLQLRANQIHIMPLTYSRALDYPVDLYYLMDLSYSMGDDKDKLSALGDSLAEAMVNITRNFRLGFGSFIDKVRMPFTKVSSALDKSKKSVTYSYHNVMPLSKDTNEFAYKVKKAVTYGNNDDPEGGLDAIMQAVVCRKEIGWREKARRLLVFSTDASFHSAGDGKLAGLIVPNDGMCHLNSEGYYTHAEILDYPSVEAIRHKVEENSINVIFAVTKDVFKTYKRLSDHIEGSSCAVLTMDSSNVVNLVREEYKKISSTIQMRDNATHHVKISYYSACGKDGAEIPTSKCDNVRVGDEITFTLHIELNSCPSDPRDWREIIQISPIGINESVIIDLEMLCGCECEAQRKTLSEQCNARGSLVCGVCECDEKYIGTNCQCLSDTMPSKSENNHFCHDNTTQVDCSGRGLCSCGVCQCDKRANPNEVISGKYCQCDNFSCERHEQKICSGPEHGTCECGKCACKTGWAGAACECQLSKETCRPPGGGQLCSGKGTCECGICKCQSTPQGYFSGQYCELCPTCSNRCDKLKDCVQCQMYKSGKFKNLQDCFGNCTSVKTSALDNETIEEYELIEGEKKCTAYDDVNKCKFTFIFKEMDDGTDEVRAQREPDCWLKVAILRILCGGAGAILGIGLATLLLWKLITRIQDHREYMRFEKEKLLAEWKTNNNPLYRQATSTFKNPMFRFSRRSN
ncbi:integrin beta-PS-like [Rhagoletis pomonella]|uniref:integrin beta-PS-like n=1 Tax=Rhagoletis pomonella TaxID=28610 RepID=UPI00177DC23C|nr:integrin beta-PS-like [Rhagoletis pomonella]